MFSGGIEKQHRAVMSEANLSELFNTSIPRDDPLRINKK